MIDRARLFGISVLFVAFLLGAINSISATSLSILDNDPASYIIVVMLMLFVFIAFSIKENLRPVFNRMHMAVASLVFAAYIITVSYLRVALSFAFGSYRIDALLFPLLLIALILALFGYEGIKRLKHAIIYSAFASPILLLPIIALNNAFANVNAGFVYDALRAAGVQAAKSGLIITAQSAASITISTTCVSLGTFIAVVMFLIPVAYLYNGSLKKRIVWIISAFALMVALNLARMLSISLIWANYGLGSAISTFHAFAGQLIFYAVIIIMLIISYKFGLSLRQNQRMMRKRAAREERLGQFILPAAVAVAFGVVAFAFSAPYWTMLYASASMYSSNATYTSLNPYVLAALSASGSNAAYLSSTNAGQLFAVGGFQNASSATYAIVNGALRPIAGIPTTTFNSIEGLHSYVLKNGVTISGATATSGNATFDIAYFSMPFNVSNGYASANIELFRRITNTNTGCSIGNPSSLGLVSYLESGFYNLVHGSYASPDGMMLCYAYRIASTK
ncbi:MAG: exosortase/archaeosortase family protein [Candidatus Micrarchaeota archaeon]|nr:exosortase/archaeosortase family protein [Candidatus Micrarchaeota archaeon]